jgi:enoyl-CoA hydratase/carnithine racemase
MPQLTSSFVRSEFRQGAAVLTIARPEASNSLNPAMVHQLHAAFLTAAADPQTRGIIIAAEGKTFVAGADVNFFLRNIEAGTIDRIVGFTRACHALLAAIERCEKPVIACVHGPALGGGVELALACNRIFAAPAAKFTLPETGLGIYPGMGGTQRLPRRIGVGLAKWMIFTGSTVPAEEARQIGLVDAVVPSEELEAAACRAIHEGLPPKSERNFSPEQTALEKFFTSYSVATLQAGAADTAGNPRLIVAMRRVAAKPPIALRLAERIIDEGLRRSLEDGLHLEIEHLTEVFSTQDARDGLLTLRTMYSSRSA